MRIVGIAGSVRKASYNGALLRAAAEVAPAGTQLDIATIANVPLYDGDVEAERGIPSAVVELKDLISGADGLLLATPEYNNSMPGVFKNAVDWLSRPPKDIPRVFRDKPVALIGATPGQGGTRFAQSAWLPVLRTLGTSLWTGKQLYVAGAGKLFDSQGRLTDPDTKKRLGDFMDGFAKFVAHASR
jgi:NAD(P)H-dependent FMN reductase